MLDLPHSDADNIAGDGEAFSQLAGAVSHDWRIFRTRRGYLGLGPACMQEDDTVVVLDGDKMAYILRPLPDSGHAFMGECFVYAIRSGKAYAMVGENGVGWKVFTLY